MVEDPEIQTKVLESGKVDTIISEPIGVMLLHERMVSLVSCSTLRARCVRDGSGH